MINKFSGLIAVFIILLAVWINFNFEQPSGKLDEVINSSRFSTQMAFEHVKALGKNAHYVGSANHSTVRNYIVDQLQQLGLEVQTQEAYNLNNQSILVKPQNILARIKGTENGNALVLMTHYDSAMHSSPGASDAGSGVATILEGLRAFLKQGKESKNDIIILFTDAEELGLNGAELFVKDHPWAKDAKLALNFEARGSGGNSFMLLETNSKNANLIKAFKNANPEYPVGNSLAYSIYKMLPNDTDLTVLREQASINGYNFAFIDDHFDYHTANDTPENLNMETLAHQGSYLMPLLDYFKDIDLESLNSDQDLLYFNIPFGGFITYPFSWIFPMLFIAALLFIALVSYGLIKKRFTVTGIFKGFIPLFLSLLLGGFLVWAFWKFCLFIYPQYGEMEHGFTYNGYWYIAASLVLALCISLFVYHNFQKKMDKAALFVAPLFLWLLICTLASFFLKGAAYFIIPFYFALMQLFFMIRQKRPNLILMALLSVPAIFILLPFIRSFPVALGLKILFVSAILLILLFSLLLPVFGYSSRNKSLAIICFFVFNILVFTAHFYSDFNEERPKPNSLVYVKDLDSKKANWYSYDRLTDSLTAPYFGDDPEIIENSESNFSSKYATGFRLQAAAPEIKIPEPTILLRKTDSSKNGILNYSLKIAPNRPINKMELFANIEVDFLDFKVNGLEADEVYLGQNAFHMFKRRWKNRLLTYYASNQDTLQIEFSIKRGEKPKFVLYESAYDLFENEKLKVPDRSKDMIPRPFVLNDATILKKTIRLKN